VDLSVAENEVMSLQLENEVCSDGFFFPAPRSSLKLTAFNTRRLSKLLFKELQLQLQELQEAASVGNGHGGNRVLTLDDGYCTENRLRLRVSLSWIVLQFASLLSLSLVYFNCHFPPLTLFQRWVSRRQTRHEACYASTEEKVRFHVCHFNVTTPFCAGGRWAGM